MEKIRVYRKKYFQYKVHFVLTFEKLFTGLPYNIVFRFVISSWQAISCSESYILNKFNISSGKILTVMGRDPWSFDWPWNTMLWLASLEYNPQHWSNELKHDKFILYDDVFYIHFELSMVIIRLELHELANSFT